MAMGETQVKALGKCVETNAAVSGIFSLGDIKAYCVSSCPLHDGWWQKMGRPSRILASVREKRGIAN